MGQAKSSNDLSLRRPRTLVFRYIVGEEFQRVVWWSRAD
jgi:hypothetical protein